MHKDALICPVCRQRCSLLDVVDFNKSCEERRGTFLSPAGVPIYYAFCGGCGFCFAPEMSTWSLEKFEDKVYNDDYAVVDPDYKEVRPRGNAGTLVSLFGSLPRSVRHLDYGGGNGVLVDLLRTSGWNSISYDPLVNRDVSAEQLGRFELITAFEVFEHVPDVQQLMSHLRSLLAPDGLVLFSTLLSDGSIHRNQRLSWWYASPRNGHISLFSRNSLALLAQNHGFHFGSFSVGCHILFSNIPPWAAHIIRVSNR